MATTTINGYQLRELLRQWELRRDTLINLLDSSLMAFPDDGEKPDPLLLTRDFIAAERAISLTQEAQSHYNLLVNVIFQGKPISLCRAVKSIGSFGRLAKFWRAATGAKKKDRWEEREALTRKTDEIRAQRTVTQEVALAQASKFDAMASELRAAISTGNTVVQDLQSIGLDPSILTVG